MHRFSSIRLRLLAYAAGVILVALGVTGIGLTTLFERFAERRIGQELDVYLAQLTGGVRFDETGKAFMAHTPADPRFNQVFGGLYWQINKIGNDVILRSRSLWDSELKLPDDALRPGQSHEHRIPGPDGIDVLVHERAIVVADVQGNVQMIVSVAVNIRDLKIQTSEFSGDMIPGLVLLGAILLIGFAIQISAGLKPMQALKGEIAAVRDGRATRLNGPVPKEVAPLVEEVNALLDRQEKEMIRARDRAADLAHGLKTPLTALATDIGRLKDKGEFELADDIEDIAQRMRHHLDRELARARLRHGRYAAAIPIEPALSALVRTLKRTPSGSKLDLQLAVDPTHCVAMEVDDIHEVFGNLLENATRHAKSRVLIRSELGDGHITLHTEDDGPGLSQEQIEQVSQRGQRLDTNMTGAGLGLSIVADIVEANNGTLTFSRSELGGLKASCRLKSVG